MHVLVLMPILNNTFKHVRRSPLRDSEVTPLRLEDFGVVSRVVGKGAEHEAAGPQREARGRRRPAFHGDLRFPGEVHTEEVNHGV